jgi:hypothetical protein
VCAGNRPETVQRLQIVIQHTTKKPICVMAMGMETVVMVTLMVMV